MGLQGTGVQGGWISLCRLPQPPGKQRGPLGAGWMPGAGAGKAGWGSRKGSPAPPPLGESCGSRREACEYTQTLWSLPCKSWQDAASSELIHVRSPARPGHAGGDVPGAPRDPAPRGARRLGAGTRAQPILPLSLQVPLTAAPCPVVTYSIPQLPGGSGQEPALMPGCWL